MTIIRRADQILEPRRPGVNRLVMAGPTTGATMLSVSDLMMEAGSTIPYHVHPNTEESMYLVEGELVAMLDGKRFRFAQGDCMIATMGRGHGFINESDMPARMITMYPTTSPEMTPIDDSGIVDGRPESGVTFRSEAEPFEFFPGISRYDMVGDFTGAASTYMSELIFESGALAPNHYHPAHEEAMFCLSGGLTAVYGAEDDVPLSGGDIFTCEIAVRHGVFSKAGTSGGRLLALHPVLNPPPRVDVD